MQKQRLMLHHHCLCLTGVEEEFENGWSEATQRVNIRELIRTSFLVISVAVAVGSDGSVGDAWFSLAAYFEALGPSAASSGFPKQQSISDNAIARSQGGLA
jgi:hypothetical protein